MPEAMSIAALRAEAETAYEALPLTLESGAAVWLRSMLMLAEAEYATVEQLLEEITAASADNRLTNAIGAMRRLLLLVAEDPATLEPELTGWPLGLLVNLIERWQSGTQAPEASSSAS